jgi:hypothetical protein
MHHYISCIATKEDTNAEKIARLLISNVWKLHELSNIIISNRESQFISFVWKIMCQMLKINIKLSIAFHSEIDDQSEIANQEIKRYLRNYCNYQQDDWFEWLFMTEFASNAATFAFIELFAFMINYDFKSRISYNSSNSNEVVSREWLSARERVLTKKVVIITKKMKNIWNFIKKMLINAQNMQKKHANRHRTFSFIYKIEDMIWLFIKNIKIERSFRKLNYK